MMTVPIIRSNLGFSLFFVVFVFVSDMVISEGTGLHVFVITSKYIDCRNVKNVIDRTSVSPLYVVFIISVLERTAVSPSDTYLSFTYVSFHSHHPRTPTSTYLIYIAVIIIVVLFVLVLLLLLLLFGPFHAVTFIIFFYVLLCGSQFQILL